MFVVLNLLKRDPLKDSHIPTLTYARERVTKKTPAPLMAENYKILPPGMLGKFKLTRVRGCVVAVGVGGDQDAMGPGWMPKSVERPDVVWEAICQPERSIHAHVPMAMPSMAGRRNSGEHYDLTQLQA